MMNGIWFDDTHSYDDLNLILSSVNIPPATPKTNFVDIPGGDGSVDLTEALGEVKFKDRECTFTFTVLPTDDFEVKKRLVSDWLNGRKFQINLDKDPDYYWIGRCSVSGYASDKKLHNIVVKAVVAPYKLKCTQTVVSAKSGEKVTVHLRNGRKTVIPTITCTAETTIEFGGNTFKFNAGTHRNLDMALHMGDNFPVVTSTAPVMFTYQEGDL